MALAGIVNLTTALLYRRRTVWHPRPMKAPHRVRSAQINCPGSCDEDLCTIQPVHTKPRHDFRDIYGELSGSCPRTIP